LQEGQDEGEVQANARLVHVYRVRGGGEEEGRRLRAQESQEEEIGEVPPELEQLAGLPGVGRKTAKVVLGEAFGIAAGVTVDTHVRRVARRLGLTKHEDPEKIATDLEKMIPRDQWIRFSMRMILHGRRDC